MFRALFIVLLFMIVTPALAQDWRIVADSADGSRLLVDVSTVNVEKYKKGDKLEGIRIYAVMSYIAKSEEFVFTSTIDVGECLGKRSGSLISKSKNSIDTYFWSFEGNKMYDAQGQWLCGIVIGGMETAQKKKEQKTTQTF